MCFGIFVWELNISQCYTWNDVLVDLKNVLVDVNNVLVGPELHFLIANDVSLIPDRILLDPG